METICQTIHRLRLFYRTAQPLRPSTRKRYRCVMCPKKTTTTVEMASHIAEAHSFLKLAAQSNDGTVAERTAQASENLTIIKANLKTKPSLNEETAATRQKRLEILENTTAGDIQMRSMVKCVPCAEMAPLWQCLACRQRFVDKMDLFDHVQLRHVESEQNKNGPLKLRMLGHCCEVCGRCYDELEYMIGHHLVMHPDAKPPSFEYLQCSTDWAMLCFFCLQYYRRSEKWFTAHNCTNSIDLDALEKTKCAVSVDPCFLCDVCAATYRYKCVYQYHRLVAHKGVTDIDWSKLEPTTIPFVCEECDKGFSTVEHFGAHLCDSAADDSAQTWTRKVRCKQCNSKFRSVETMERHVKVVHENLVRYVPERRGKIYRPDIPTIKCPFCEELKFKTSKDMLAHAKEVHNQELRNPYYCAKCDKEFMSNTKLKEHCENTHLGPQEQKTMMEVCKLAERTIDDNVFYECTSCSISRKFLDPMAYFRHHQRHQMKGEFTCDRCGRTLLSRRSLRSHMQIAHRDTTNPQFKCDQCNSVLSSRSSLREHQASIHATERAFMCERCGKDFATKGRLQAHVRGHVFGWKRSVNKQRRYICAQCGKEFKKKESLRNHLAVHSGIKNVPCPECGELFYSKVLAYFHKLNVHCTERPFKCTVCEASFPLRSYLTRHMKKHEEKTTSKTVNVAQTSQWPVVMKSATHKKNESLKETPNSETAQSFLRNFSS